MRFKEWLKVDEARFKGLKRLFQQQHPNMPRYVQNDLYNNRIGFTMGQLIDRHHGMNRDYNAPTVGMDDADTSPKGFTRTSDSDIPSDTVSRIFQAHDLEQYKDWPKEKLYVDPSDFDHETVRRMIERNFGYRENPRIRDDVNRTRLQRDMIQKMMGDNQPVIVIQSPEQPDKYRLLEGWHRTMAIFLQGAPEGQHNALQDLNTDPRTYLDFTYWRKMPLVAFVGNVPEEQAVRRSA